MGQIFGFTNFFTYKFMAKAEGEFEHPNTEIFGYKEMPQLMKKDQNPQNHNKGENIVNQ